ncbi:MAG TPA: PEGA domain-containing protein, partial [Kofleriaceae bacterium]|nr:PEGA domain-containing protein [Kofleriaceae bacterium]
MTKQKALCVATRCTTSQQFIETFYRFCDAESFFVATMNLRPVGLETPFSIQLADKTPVLRGLCVVLAAWSTPANEYKRPGIRLGIRRLTPESEPIFAQLQARRTVAPPGVVGEAAEVVHETPVAIPLPPIPKVSRPTIAIPRTPTPRAGSTITVPPKRPSIAPPIMRAKPEQRTPGSELVLPANPLQNLTDASLGGFVDCTLYEETGNFFLTDAAEKGTSNEPPLTIPLFRPNEMLVEAFPDEPTNVHPAEDAPAVHVADLPPDPDVVASLARVEYSVSRLLDVVDSSRPLDASVVSDQITLPAGEAYAVPPKRRARWVIGGAAAVMALLVVVLVVVLVVPRPSEPVPAVPAPPPPQAKAVVPDPLVEPPGPKPRVDKDKPARTSNAPVAGAGPCRLDVTTTPAGTMVLVDGQSIGPSPITIEGPCTRRQVSLSHPRYKPEQRWVALAEGKPGSLDVTLVRPTHMLHVTSTPPGATVSI